MPLSFCGMRRANSLHVTMHDAVLGHAHVGEVVVEDLERVADLRVQPVVLAVGLGAALVGVRVVAAVAQLEEARVDVRAAPLLRRRR